MAKKFPRLLAVVGPTASGKTGLAARICRHFRGEIVSADSRQVYRGMDIGTAKEKKIRGVTQHLIDVADPDEEFTLAQFQQRAFGIISAVHDHGLLPVITGGTGLYVSAVIDNWQIPEVPPDAELRSRLEGKDIDDLADELKELDPETYGIIDRGNKRRLVRAIEVVILTGKSFASQQTRGEPRYDVLQVGMKRDRDVLDKRIDVRVDRMVKRGLFKEVRRLGEQYGWELPAMSGIGYRQVGMYLREEITRSEAIEMIKRDTRKYARRQMTWFRRDKRIKWVASYKEAKPLISAWLAR